MIGTPNFRPGYDNGQVVIYNNSVGEADWTVYRNSAPIVDTDAIQNVQLYSVSTNNTLDNLDYIDPIQGKIAGPAEEELAFTTPFDPATYTTSDQASVNVDTENYWANEHVGKLWWDISTDWS